MEADRYLAHIVEFSGFSGAAVPEICLILVLIAASEFRHAAPVQG